MFSAVEPVIIDNRGLTVADWLTLIAAITAAIVTSIGAWKTGAVQREVQTFNGRTMAQLADAAETRRVYNIHPDDRTEADQEHIHVVPAELTPSEEKVKASIEADVEKKKK